MLEHAVYAVASPEASAAILWHDAAQASEAARMMKITAQDVYAMGFCDEIIPEPAGGAHTDPGVTIAAIVEAVLRHLAQLAHGDQARLLHERYGKYRQLGCLFERETIPVAAPVYAPVLS
jgi:acetyl-CoA carboxylase carboxyl transferase subunit alpha